MPLGGERVGTAFVQLIADGSSVPDDIREAMEKLEPTLREAGSDHAEAYQKGFDEQYEADDEKFRRKLDKRLSGALGKMAATGRILGERVGDNLFDGIQASLSEAFDDDVAERIRQNLQAAFAQDQSLVRLKARIADINREAILATKQLSSEAAKVEADRIAERIRLEREWYSETDKITRSVERITKAANTELIKGNDEVRKSYDSLRTSHLSLLREYEKYGVEIDKTHRKVGAFTHALDETGDIIGKVTGKGSRNNFLNFFGSFVSILPNAISGVARLGGTLSELGAEAGAAFKTAGGGLEGFNASLSVLVRAGAGGLAGAAAAFVALEFAASAASLAVGGLSAVIGTVGTGLIGGIGLLAAALVPLAASIGAVVTAYMSMSDAQKQAFSADIGPLTDAFGKLGDIASRRVFGGLGEELAGLAPEFRELDGLVRSVSSAVRGNIDSWVALMDNGAFTSFFDTMATDLPGQISYLNGIVQNLTTTFTGFFNAVSPVLTAFLGDLDTVTERFSNWTNSVAGSKSIQDFFKVGLDSLRAMGSALVSAGRLLGNFFRIGAESGGNELFRDLSDTFADWNKYIKENQESVASWIEDGADFLRMIGDLTVNIGKFIAALDSPAMRTVVTGTLQGLSFAFEALAFAIDNTWKASERFLGPFLGPLQAGAENLISTLDFVGISFGDSAKEADKSSEAIHSNARAFTAAVDAGESYSETQAAIDRAQKRFLATQKRTSAAAHDTAKSFLGLATDTDKARLSAQRWIEQMNKQARAMVNFGDNIRTLAERGLREGLIKQLEKLGPAGTLAAQQLANGTKTQIERANEAFLRGKRGAKSLSDSFVDAANIINGKKISPNVDTGAAEQNLNNLQAKLNAIDFDRTIKVTVNTVMGALPKFATGGIVSGPTNITAGEAGAEAIVPLNRPLSQVDPSVRGLSAIAQGYAAPGGTGTTVDVGGVTIITPTRDPAAVATETINKIVAAAM